MSAPSLETQFDARGITRLSYNGVTLIDLAAKKGDGFSVGTYRLNGRDNWGSVNNKASWDAASHKITWAWNWGSVDCVFEPMPANARLRLSITVTNKSGETLDGINVYPLGLQLPSLAKGFGAPNYPQFRNGLDTAPVLIADYGTNSLTLLHREPDGLYVGLSPSGPPNHYMLQTGSVNDNSAGFLSRVVPVRRPLANGATDRFTLELRWSAPGATIITAADDVVKQYVNAWPQKLNWTDRRPIGQIAISDGTAKARDAKSANPRGYSFARSLDLRTDDGKKKFSAAALAFADDAVKQLKAQNAQAFIVWDLEGQQFPQPGASYIGDPSALPKLAPEMDAVVDEFFRRFTKAGLRCGVTVRPQRLEISGGVAKQGPLKGDEAGGNLLGKMQYARKRWGCSIFYIDSDGGPGDPLAPSIFADLLAKMPDVLMIPENAWPKTYAYAAPLGGFGKALETPADVRAIWPKSFTVTFVGNAPGHSLKSQPEIWQTFKSAVAHGDVLAFRGWFDDPPLNHEVSELRSKVH